MYLSLKYLSQAHIASVNAAFVSTHGSIAYLEPIDRTAVDERRKLTQPVTERVADRRKCDDEMKILATAIHEKRKHGQRTVVGVGAHFLIHGGPDTLKICIVNRCIISYTMLNFFYISVSCLIL